MKYLLLPLVLSLTACGTIVHPVDFPSPVPTVTVTITPSPTPAQEVEEEQTLEGYYSLPDGGYVDLYEDSAGTVSLRIGRIMVKNSDGTTGLMPLTTFNQLTKLNKENKVSYVGSQTYVALTHNIKANNSAIVGAYQTHVIFYKNDKGLLQLNIVIFNNSTVLSKFEISE